MNQRLGEWYAMTGETSDLPRNKYGVYKLPEGVEHRPAVQTILAGQPHEPKTLEFMRTHVRQGDIIHAGAFFGDFIPALSSGLAPGAHLWAFEPNPANYAAAKETVALNHVENATLTNAALSNTESTILFRTRDPEGRPLGGGSRFVERPGRGVESVQAVILDRFVPLTRPVTILQLDVEGHEKPALLGASQIIRTWKPTLILEKFKDQAWLDETFPEVGYRLIGKVHYNQVYVAKDSDVRL
jgi:FkbM family methyltransferase